MIAVNDRLGFHAVENLCEYQRGVTLTG